MIFLCRRSLVIAVVIGIDDNPEITQTFLFESFYDTIFIKNCVK